MWSKCVSLGLVEDVCKVVVFFQDQGEIRRGGLGCGGSLGGNVFEIECKLLGTQQFTSSEESYHVD